MEASVGTDSQDSDDLVPPGIAPSEYDKSRIAIPRQNLVSTPTSSPRSNTKGVQNAKKKLRAFSIQKKKAITPVSVPKPVNTGSATVLIGKLSSVKTTPKPDKDVDAEKKPPKPPKPGDARRRLEASYSALQKRTLCEIEDMKRKMELVELGIPLGLICPSPTSEQAMPTKAMPPIKTFLDHSKVDELIREAKKARAAGKEFKFDYQKLLPDYDNPFQRKKDDLNVHEKDKREEEYHRERKEELERAERRISGKWYDKHSDYDKHPDYDKHDKIEEKEKDKQREEKEKHKSREREKPLKDEVKKSHKETDVNLSEYVVCDSWSLDTEDRSVPSPKVEKALKLPEKEKPKEPMEILLDNVKKKDNKSADSPPSKPKLERLKPVIDAFKFDIDPNEEDDAFMSFNDCQIDNFAKKQPKKDVVYDSPIDLKLFDYDQDMSKDIIDANDDNFLESVINEIKQENMSDDTSQDNMNRTGLVEYDSPNDEDFKLDTSQGSVTPELDDRMRDLQSSQQSHYSDGYRSTESYKSTESGYKSTESYISDYKPMGSRHRANSRQSDDFRLPVEKEPDNALDQRMTRSTVDSLETWSFVLKICQPLLFRHDKNKCYKETHSPPKLWYTANPKWCDCVKGRSVVYEELEMCKMTLVDRVYGCDQIPDGACSVARAWYPRVGCAGEGAAPPPSTDWETDEPPRSTTPLQDGGLDQEYQRFIESVWPDVAEPKSETTRSTTPDRSEKGRRQESRKKKKIEDGEKATEDRKKAKKMKLSSEGWSQESDFEEEVVKSKKIKTEKVKTRKRKHSTSSSDSDSTKDSKKKKKIKKKNLKSKAKMGKKRRVTKKIKKKLKEKKKIKRKIKIEKISIDSEKEEKDKKKENKLKKKTQIKAKKPLKKKKAKPVTSSSSSSSYSSSDSEAEARRKKIKKKELLLKKKKKDKKKKRKESTDSTHSEDLFDVNILKNIKTERLSDEENHQQMNDFSPRRQKNKTKEREIINVKELQNDFVGNNIHIKQEKEDVVKETVSAAKVSGEKSTPETRDVPEPVEIKSKVIDHKDKSPSLEPLSPDIPLIEESQIPLPDDTKIRPNNNITIVPEKQEQTIIHLTAESNIPLPAEMKTQNIPEPPPQIVEKVPQITEKVPQVIQKISQVIEKVPQVIEKIPQVVPQVIEKVPQVIERVPKVIEKVPKVIEKVPHVTEKIPQVIEQVPQVKERVPHVKERVPQVIEKVAQVIEKVPQFIEIVPQVIEKVPQVIERVPQVIEKVPQVIEKVPQIIEKVPRIIEKVPQGMEKCIEPHLLSYGYTDVTASQNDLYSKGIEDSDDKFIDYDEENYEMYEQMAMAYQSDVANQVLTIDQSGQARPIETVVRCRRRGEIKCDWRAADNPAPASASATAPATRPSRWGLKPGEVNIVLTGGPSSEPATPAEHYPIRSVCEPVYKIQSLANRHDSSNTSIDYDEAYQVTYGASDRLQYGDCFGEPSPAPSQGDSPGDRRRTKLALSASTLDERINRVLQQTALGEAAKDTEDLVGDRDAPEKGILVTKAVDPRLGKRVSFADGYKPGQDSDTEEPPLKRKKKSRRYGCAWPCPASHPDHVPLWDALPPPPPPRSPPPPPAAPPPPLHLLRAPPLHMVQRASKTGTSLLEHVPLWDALPPPPPPPPAAPPPPLHLLRAPPLHMVQRATKTGTSLLEHVPLWDALPPPPPPPPAAPPPPLHLLRAPPLHMVQRASKTGTSLLEHVPLWDALPPPPPPPPAAPPPPLHLLRAPPLHMVQRATKTGTSLLEHVPLWDALPPPPPPPPAAPPPPLHLLRAPPLHMVQRATKTGTSLLEHVPLWDALPPPPPPPPAAPPPPLHLLRAPPLHMVQRATKTGTSLLEHVPLWDALPPPPPPPPAAPPPPLHLLRAPPLHMVQRATKTGTSLLEHVPLWDALPPPPPPPPAAPPPPLHLLRAPPLHMVQRATKTGTSLLEHVPLWDALPPPPPPPPAAPPPPLHLLRAPPLHMVQRATKTDPTMSLPPFMPPEPPPGMISFQ